MPIIPTKNQQVKGMAFCWAKRQLTVFQCDAAPYVHPSVFRLPAAIYLLPGHAALPSLIHGRDNSIRRSKRMYQLLPVALLALWEQRQELTTNGG